MPTVIWMYYLQKLSITPYSRYVYKYGLDRVMRSHKIIRRDKHDHDEESDADEDIAILEQNLLDVDLNARKTRQRTADGNAAAEEVESSPDEAAAAPGPAAGPQPGGVDPADPAFVPDWGSESEEETGAVFFHLAESLLIKHVIGLSLLIKHDFQNSGSGDSGAGGRRRILGHLASSCTQAQAQANAHAAFKTFAARAFTPCACAEAAAFTAGCDWVKDSSDAAAEGSCCSGCATASAAYTASTAAARAGCCSWPSGPGFSCVAAHARLARGVQQRI